MSARGAVTPTDAFAVVDQRLRNGDWEAARDLALAQIEDACGSLRAAYLGGAVARLALAEAGSGRATDAVWHWYVAQNLDRGAFSREELASFGEAGAMIARHPLRQPGEVPGGLTVYRADEPASGIRPPRKVAGEPPTFSSAVGRLPLPKALHVEAVIDADGQLDAPVVIGGAVPGVIWEALEALRHWRYEPARRSGEAVAVFRDLRLNPPVLQPISELVKLAPEEAAAEALLRAGRWEEAQRRALQAWTAALEERQPRRERLAAGLLLRALAEAGTGDSRSAICRWQAAQHVDDRLYAADLTPYGAAGVLLARHRWGAAARPGAVDGGRPELKKWRPVRIPGLPARSLLSGAALFTGTVDAEGGLHQPLILLMRSNVQGATTPVAFSYEDPLDFTRLGAVAALDALCSWTFEPARLGGQAVTSELLLPVSFGRAAAGVAGPPSVMLGGTPQNRAAGPDGWTFIGPVKPPVPVTQRPR